MGQMVYFKNNKDQKLTGLLNKSSSKNFSAVVVSPSLRGDKTYQPILEPLAETLQGEGYTILRYDAAGFGDSEGKSEDMAITSQAEDLTSAINFVKTLSINPQYLGIIGFSIGATSAILNAQEEGVKTLVLWSPPFEHQTLYKRYQKYLPEIEQKGYFDSEAKLTGRSYRIGKKFIEECRTMDLTDAIENIQVPTLVIYGEKDPIIKSKTVEKYTNLIPSTKHLEIIPGADHDFLDPEIQKEVIKLTSAWLKIYLK